MRPKSNPFTRFWSKVTIDDPTGCWLWTASTTDEGYGQFWLDGTYVRAHRFAYELLVGPIPEGLVLDHVRARGCRHRSCVNPAHLEPVTQSVNVLRGDNTPPPINPQSIKTHCPQGHPLSGDNVSYYRNKRRCRACHREQQKAYVSRRADR